jgi:hypothetical protein
MSRLPDVAISGAFVVLCIVGISAARSAANEQESANVQQIKKNRLANAKNLHEYVVKNYPAPSDAPKGNEIFPSTAQVIDAKTLLLKLQLEHAATKGERLDVYKDALKQSRDFEARVKKFAQGFGRPYDALRYTDWLLELELAFEREKTAK